MTAQLQKKLPKIPGIRRPVNHPSLSYDEARAFMASLREREGVAALALEFVILTASRTNEVIGANWAEMNLANAIWTIPKERMKGGRLHRVPLSPAAMDVLRRAKAFAVGNFVFPSLPHDRALSNMALLTVLRRMGRRDLTVHGFRSTFRTWTAERTNFPREVCEAALAHVLKDKTEAAYQRGDLFDKRVRLMNDWAEFCDRPTK
jgi:integrase